MKTTKLILGVFAAFAFAAVPACDDKKDDKKAEDKKDGKKDDKKAEEKKAEEKKAEEKKADAPAEEKKEEAKADAPAGGGDKIGIPECDEYIEKYSKCIADKVPEQVRAQMNEAMTASTKAWKEAANGPAKEGLAASCKTALEAAKTATASFGCTW
jgi:hypothetical protein